MAAAEHAKAKSSAPSAALASAAVAPEPTTSPQLSVSQSLRGAVEPEPEQHDDVEHHQQLPSVIDLDHDVQEAVKPTFATPTKTQSSSPGREIPSISPARMQQILAVDQQLASATHHVAMNSNLAPSTAAISNQIHMSSNSTMESPQRSRATPGRTISNSPQKEYRGRDAVTTAGAQPSTALSAAGRDVLSLISPSQQPTVVSPGTGRFTSSTDLQQQHLRGPMSVTSGGYAESHASVSFARDRGPGHASAGPASVVGGASTGGFGRGRDQDLDANGFPAWMTQRGNATTTGLHTQPTGKLVVGGGPTLSSSRLRSRSPPEGRAAAAAVIEGLRLEISAKDKIINDLTNRLARITLQADGAKDAKQMLAESTEAHKHESQELRNELQRVRRDAESETGRLNRQLKQLQQQLSDYESALRERDREILERGRSLRSAHQKLAQHQDNESSLRRDLEAKQLAVDDVTAMMASTQSQLETLEAEYRQYQEDTAVAQSARAAAEDEVARLKSLLDGSASKMSKLQQAKMVAERKAEALSR